MREQVYASAPDQGILLDTATSFLQGLYPPLGDIRPQVAAQTLANGSSVSSPLDGYQYVTLHGVREDSPATVWIKGDDNCPAVADAAAEYAASPEFQARVSATRDFYRSLHPLVADVYASPDDLSYARAYDVFDVINVARIHNASSPAANVTESQLHQLRTLADEAEFARNFDASRPSRSIHGATFAGAVLRHLERTRSSAGHNPKFTLLAGSYDTFLAFFGLTNLTAASPDFFGLPEYASTMVFELFTPAASDNDDRDGMRVRFLFRNGTAGALTAFPLFGSATADLPWHQFRARMLERSITSVWRWCAACASRAPFCAEYRGAGDRIAALAQDRASWIVLLSVAAVALAGNVVWFAIWVARWRRDKIARRALPEEEDGRVGKEMAGLDGSESVQSSRR